MQSRIFLCHSTISRVSAAESSRYLLSRAYRLFRRRLVAFKAVSKTLAAS